MYACTVVYCNALHCTALHYTILYCIVLFCIVLYCTVLYFTLLYCTLFCYHNRELCHQDQGSVMWQLPAFSACTAGVEASWAQPKLEG